MVDFGSRQTHASMGPRSDDRGDAKSGILLLFTLDMLQWGRGPMTAEIIGTPTSWSESPVLQWGRGPMTAEIVR